MPERRETLLSTNPATGQVLWKGNCADISDCAALVARCRTAQVDWAAKPQEHRQAVLERYAVALENRADAFAADISRENGKPLWEARAEVGSMIAKVGLSIRAQHERALTKKQETDFGHATLDHRPHGVFAVFGPFNFPGHLPNGHIVPALLAGNGVIFKPSEKTPMAGEHIAQALSEAGLPEDLFALVQGGPGTGEAVIDQDIDGLLFTGSSKVASLLRARLADRPHIILALELGGNNPLIAWDGDPAAAASIIAQSAFISTGQRCSCARRLILPHGPWGDEVLQETASLAQRLRIGHWDSKPEPYMGPLIDEAAAKGALAAQSQLVELGAKLVLPLSQRADLGPAFVTPGIADVTGIDVPDEEIFAPFLQVTRVHDWPSALQAANDTKFGLAAGLISENNGLWSEFRQHIRAGVVNRNRPTTGASGAMPFGGVGESGNHRPSAWYAADYCAYPVASQEATKPESENLARFTTTD